MTDEGWWGLSSTGFRPAPQRVHVPWFDDVLEAMAAAPTRLAGVVRAHVEDEGGTDFTYRVVRDGGRVRCSSLDGAVHVIAGTKTVWTRRDNANELVIETVNPHLLHVPDDYEFGVRPFDSDRWEGDDFTAPVGGPDEVTVLGRPAWCVVLAPPPHKPEPMQIVIDQQTFVILREGNEAFGTYHEWSELDLDPDIDEDTFTWRDDDRIASRYQ